MYILKGKIYTVTVISDKKAFIVVEKQQDGKKTLVAAEVYGKWKHQADALKLKKGDKIRGRLYMDSRLYNNKWYTDLSFRAIEVIKPAVAKKSNELFEEEIIGEVKHLYDSNGNILL